MKYALRILLLLSLISTFSMAQSTSHMSNPNQVNAQFAKMTDQFVKDSLALSPVNASQAGYHKHLDPKTGKTIDLDAQLDDVSAQGIAAQENFYREWRQRFQTETPVAGLNAQDAADYRLIDDQIALNLLEFDQIQNYKHNPTGYVELIGNGLFLPLTQEYASKEVRVGDVISRIGQIPRFLDQAKSQLTDADPIFISTAVEENEGNINLLDSVSSDIPAGSPLKAQYDKVAPAAKKALTDFNAWMQNDLAKRAHQWPHVAAGQRMVRAQVSLCDGDFHRPCAVAGRSRDRADDDSRGNVATGAAALQADVSRSAGL